MRAFLLPVHLFIHTPKSRQPHKTIGLLRVTGYKKTKPFHATQAALNGMISIDSSAVIVINLLSTQLTLHTMFNFRSWKTLDETPLVLFSSTLAFPLTFVSL